MLGGDVCLRSGEGIESLRMVLRVVFGDVVGACEVSFSGCVQAGDPAPRECVAGGIGIEQVIEKKLCTLGPGELEVMNPVGGPPHAGVVVEVAGVAELAREVVHDGASCGACDGFFCERAEWLLGESGGIVPNGGMLGEIAFPVGAPTDFLEEFFDCGEGVSI